jgi:bile acid:Na+ symporter, BASS family
MKWYEVIQKYFGLVFFAGLALGFGFPRIFLPLSEVTLYILGAVITISFTTMDFAELRKTVKQFYLPIVLFLFYKIAVPLGLYFFAVPIDRTAALSVLLFSAVPVGMMTPALVMLVGGNRAFVLSLVVISSLTAPFYLPFLMKAFAGTVIELEPLGMMFSLAKLIFIPLIISIFIRKLVKKLVEKTKHLHSTVSILLLFFILLGIAAQGSPYILRNPVRALLYLGVSTLLIAFLGGIGFAGGLFLDKSRRIGMTVAIPYVNFALAIVIAAEYFPAGVLLFCIVSEVPGNLMPVVVRRLSRGSGAAP